MRHKVFLLSLGLAAVLYAAPPSRAAQVPLASQACGASAKIDTVVLKSEPVSDQTLGGSNGKVGQMVYLGGSKLTADDPRFGNFIGLQVDPKLGLVGLTAAGNWIVLDAADRDITKFNAAHIAPAQGNSGAPSILARMGSSFVVAGPDGRTLSRYDLAGCGLGAAPMPAGSLAPPDRLVGLAQLNFNTYLLAARDDTGARHDLATAALQPGMKPGDPVLPALPGYDLVDVVGPEAVASVNMVSLWRRPGGGERTRVQMISLAKWSNGPLPPGLPPSVMLADLPVPIRAVAGYYDAPNRVVRLWMVSQGSAKDGVMVLAFAMRAVNG